MKTLISDLEARFEYELLVFDNEVHEALRCFYIWRTLKKASRKSQKIFHQLNKNAEFWNTVDNSVQSNSLIVLGRIFDKDKTNNVERLLNLAKSSSAIFSKAALRRRREKEYPNASHIVGNLIKTVKAPTGSDFRQLEEFVAVRRCVYEKCYKQIRDQRYAHRQRGVDLSGVYALTNATELSRLFTDLKKLHDELWHWYHNGVKPQNAPPHLQHDRERYREENAKIAAVDTVEEGGCPTRGSFTGGLRCRWDQEIVQM